MFLALLPGVGGLTFAADGSPSLTYEKDIRPIFRAHCFDCHGATEEMSGGLDLRLVRFMQQGGDSGPAVVPGDPNASYLLDRVRSGEMPPGEARVTEQELATLETWVAQGAPTARPEPETIGPGLGITEEEKSFWSFQPIERPPVPETSDADRVRNAIDAFLVDAMPKGLTFSEEADRSTLIKRLYFDLIGLPPSPDEMARWTTLDDANWYEQLVDELLASEHYGERWARHWLDIAGYADSEGYTVQDAERSWAWKYRDYVIRSLNADKPFDRFIIEQLAGDELAGPREGDLTAEQIELLTATGFLRMAADGTGSGANTAEARNQVMADCIRIVSTTFLGLSMACAQCHDHRYDPIPQTDYYAMRAVFEPALDWKAWKTPQQRLISLYTEADRTRAAEVEAEAQKIAAERAEKQTVYMAQALDKELEKYEEPLRGQLRAAYETAAKERTPEQQQLLKEYPSVNITPGVLYQYLPDAAEDLKKYDARIAEVRATRPPEEFLRVLTEPAGHVPETRLFHRGDHQQPKQVIPPGTLSVVCPDGRRTEFAPDVSELPTTGRRLAYAQWLTNGNHPLVARVLVNRFWMHHFGEGLVTTPSDFGALGTRPSHPKLLDWLAAEFMEQGWSLKRFHRLIVSSTAYRQSAVRTPERVALDPTNRFYSRKSIVRLDAEVLRDRMLAATGKLETNLYGAPVPVKADETGQVSVDPSIGRRSLYVKVRRSQPVAMLEAFDAPVMETNCERRPVSTVATQSLMLMNGESILEFAAALEARSRAEAPGLDQLADVALPELPDQPPPRWQYGYGSFDESSGRITSFTAYPHWTGSAWQGGPELPDPQLGWSTLNAHGGHPDIASRSPIRRWTAPVDGTVRITGRLQHGSENGDGVRGRIVTSHSGLVGTWAAHASATDTTVAEVLVRQGETIDFIVECQANYTSDSFQWTVQIDRREGAEATATYSSADAFAGPALSSEFVPGQVIRAWELAYARRPTPEELKLAFLFIQRQLDLIADRGIALPEARSPVQQAMTNLCQALLTSNEFLYVD